MNNKPDFYEIITSVDQLKEMVNRFVPRMMRPDVWPGFAGVQLASDEWMKAQLEKAIDTGAFSNKSKFTMHTLVTDLASWYRAAGQDPPQEVMWVIFLREGKEWAYTYFCLLGEIYRVMFVLENGEEYAASEAAVDESNKKAAVLCEKMFPDDHEELLKVVNETIEKLKRGK